MFALWLFAVLVFAPFSARPLPAQSQTVRVAARITVYALAREDSDVRGTLEPGTEIVTTTRLGDWAAIRGPNDLRGWVRFSALSAAGTASPPPSRPPLAGPGKQLPPAGSELPPTMPPGSPTPAGIAMPGDQAPGSPAPPSGHGVYHSNRWLGISYQSLDEVDALSLSQARMAGSWAEIGYTITGERNPGVPEDSYFLSLSGNFRVFPLQPDGANPLGIVLEAVASMGRSLDEDAEGQLAGVGGHVGAFGRLPTGNDVVLIPRAGYQVTRLIPLPDEDVSVTVKQWYAGLELQFGTLVPNVFVGSHEERSFLVVGLTFAR